MNILDQKRKLLPMSGFQSGGSSPSSTTTSTTGLPDWAKGYAQDTLAKQAALSNRPYEAYDAPRIQGFTPMQEQARQNASNMNAGPEGFSQGIGAYMSPYMQNVVDIQKREAGRQSDIMGQQQQAQAAQVGAFGGSRDAIMRAERERNLGQQMGDIQARGSQAAYDQAANQFRQGITQGMDINRLQSAYGAQEQAMGQAGLTQAYQDWQNQRDYPQQQLGNMANMIRGLPIGSTTNSSGTYNQGSPSFGQQLGSLGSAAWGLKQFFAEGGSVDSQQNIESIVSKLSDQQLDQAEQAAKARGDAEQLQAIQMEKAARASMQRGIGAAPVDMDKMLPTEQSMARGGIVAFAGGGTGYNPNASPSSDTGEDAALDDEEDSNAPAQGPGNPAVYNEALQNQLAQAKAIAGATYESMKPEEYNRVIEERRASLLKGIGESPYEGMRADAKRLGEESAQNLKYGKGLAALQAASAMLQGNDLSRGLAAGAGAFGSAYGDAIKADQAQKSAIQRMNINIADAERKEKMGLTRDAIAAADQARKDHQAAQTFGIDKAKALGKVYQGVATTAKPGAVKAPPTLKAAEIAIQSGVATRMAREKPKQGETPEMQRDRITSQVATQVLSMPRTILSTTDIGGTSAALKGESQDVTKQKYASDREKEKVGQIKYTPAFMGLKPEEQTRRLADIKNEARAYYGLPPEAAASAASAAPAAAPKAAAKPMSATDFNAKWATLKSGQKLVGPDGIEYTKK